MDPLAALQAEIKKQKSEQSALKKTKKRWRSKAEIEMEREQQYYERQRQAEQQRIENKRRKTKYAQGSASQHSPETIESSEKKSGSNLNAVENNVSKIQHESNSKHEKVEQVIATGSNKINCSDNDVDDESNLKNDETKHKTKSKRQGDPPLSKEDVIRKLRALKQPATFYGEDDWDRFKRLRDVQISIEDPSEGQDNIYQKKLREVQAKDAAEDSYLFINSTKSAHDTDNKKSTVKNDIHSTKSTKDNSKVRICKEDFIRLEIEKYMTLWKSELEGMTNEERKSKKGRSQLATYEQTKEWLNPLNKLLNKRKLTKSILNALNEIFQAANQKEYIMAMRLYLERLAIGNAPWPMGATQVGIHSRAAREKIGEDKIAHVMNDERTRKYIQAVKRLLTVAQRHFPTQPSKMAST